MLRLTKTMRNRKLISRNVNPLGEKTTKLIQTSFGFKIKGVQKTKKFFIKENKLKKIEFKVELFVFTTKN